MIGLLLITHGELGAELIKTLEHIMGLQKNMTSISIFPEDSIESRKIQALKIIKKIDQGNGVILLTDVFGGTPSNIAISIMKKNQVELITGVNLPILIKLCSIRHHYNLEKTLKSAASAGKKHIHITAQLMNRGKP